MKCSLSFRALTVELSAECFLLAETNHENRSNMCASLEPQLCSTWCPPTKANLCGTSAVRLSGGLCLRAVPHSLQTCQIPFCLEFTASQRQEASESARAWKEQWLSECERLHHKNTTAPLSSAGARVPQPSLTVHLWASEHDGKIPVSQSGQMCVCSDQTLFSLQMPFNSLGPKIGYWKMLILSMSASKKPIMSFMRPDA